MEAVLFFGGVVFITALVIYAISLVMKKPKNKNTGIIRNLPRRGV